MLEIDDLASSINGLQLQNFNAPIGGLDSGNILRLAGFGAFATVNGTIPTYSAINNSTSLVLTDNGSPVATLDLIGGDYSSATVRPDPHVSGAVVLSVACFRHGTRILTTRGDTAVEDLQAGDLVFTVDGEAVPVKWIGYRQIDCARHHRPVDVWPVRIRAGAFGSGVPVRDLWLSPDHAVFFAGKLIPIRYLVNGRTIVQEPCASVTYFHIELAQHDILLANNTPAESYLETGQRAE